MSKSNYEVKPEKPDVNEIQKGLIASAPPPKEVNNTNEVNDKTNEK